MSLPSNGNQVLLKKEKSFTVVAIGASLGGLEAISLLLKNLNEDTGMAYIIVQHLSPNHKSLLTSILAKTTKMIVQEIENMEHIVPNNIYVMPNNKLIQVIDGHIKLNERPKNSSAISIDILFSSLAQTHKEDVIGVILSGLGKDGTLGMKSIKEAGGMTFAQDDSAQANSMPQSAIDSIDVDFVLSPMEIAEELNKIGKIGLSKSVVKLKKNNDLVDINSLDLNTIFKLLLKETGVDFSHYKMPTIKRRINHKMQEGHVTTIGEYAKKIQNDSSELDALYNDLLINVTCFFRDIEAFNYLKTTLLPKLLKSKNQDETLRIWVPACSTGEEAYTLAMILSEIQGSKGKKIPVQIFATDLSEKAIRKARLGEYSQSDFKLVSKKYLEKYFVKLGDKYQIIKSLREMCVFAPHNILRDPPFSRMDFVSCCNLLIYFDTAAQKKVFATLHFALKESGYLMLGKAETTGTSSLLFTRINNNFKIYSRKKNLDTRKFLELTPRFQRSNMVTKKISSPTKIVNTHPEGIENAIDSVLLSNYMPACAVVNKDLDILQFRGPISTFLGHPSGKANLNILKMAQPEFAFELRAAIHEAIKTKQTVTKVGLEIKVNSVLRFMTFEVCPLKIEWDEFLMLIVFTLQEEIEKISEGDDKNNASLKDKRIKKLTDELNDTRKEMNSIIESQEIMYEELQSANEEIVSSNEEFQTLNEELETSKEEIEATNEELISTNQELQIRHDLLNESYEYSEAIIATIHEPMLVLDKNFNVKSANKSFYNKFLVKKEETVGELLFDLGNKQWNIPKLRDELNDILKKNRSFENFEVKHNFSNIGEKTMLLNAHLIVQKVNSEQLILLAIEDITDRLRYYFKEKYALSLIEASLDPLLAINPEGKITDVNQATVKITGISRTKLKGTDFFDYFTEPRLARGVYQEVFSKGSVFNSPLTIRHKTGKLTSVLFNGSVYKDNEGNVLGIVIVARDITEQNLIKNELIEAKLSAESATEKSIEAKVKAELATQIAENALKSKQQFLSNMSHEIRTPMNAIIGFTKVILKTDLDEKQKEYLSAIKTSGDTLIVLINDILDLAKVDAGKMVFEKTPFELEKSLSVILHLFETKIQEKNLQLITDFDSNIPETLIGDQVRLHQIILNLVSNAVKFTIEGKITFSVRLKNEDLEKVRLEFEVSDTGIGIADNKIKSIFENFQQASSGTSRLYGGSGLGLAIVKQLVNLQNGSISVKSKVNKGSSFSFELDFEKVKKKEIETNKNSSGNFIKLIELTNMETGSKKVNVLLVEDILLNQLLMKTLLDDFGFDYEIAANGKIALEKIKSNTYDIILMDLQMPEMNGFEATEIIRKELKLTIPIIALTADVTTVDLKKCKEVGMNDYIAKPVDERLLYSKIIDLVM